MTKNVPLLPALLTPVLGTDHTDSLLRLLVIHPELRFDKKPHVSRAMMAQALNILLFHDLIGQVPMAKAYADDRLAAGETIFHDHGAVRTIAMGGMGALPAGEESIVRILRPLGYERSGIYPLDKLKMTGRAYAQRDYPESLPQFFVSELLPGMFSSAFRETLGRVTADSRDPLDDRTRETLSMLEHEGSLSIGAAVEALPVLASCFGRQHGTPALADYEALFMESSEAAWIATEGNAFNHATDRVATVEIVAKIERSLGRPVKDSVEVSKSGRVRQTAYRAATVLRPFLLANGSVIERPVPGSFYEFISRETILDVEGGSKLDLSFDSGNAQGIFKMTAGAIA